ncbi:MAG: hypothetical protein ACE5O2_10990, partial [Armatimonadota bacterium]
MGEVWTRRRVGGAQDVVGHNGGGRQLPLARTAISGLHWRRTSLREGNGQRCRNHAVTALVAMLGL